MAKRSERLLALMQALRRRRRPVAGRELAEEMGVSLRSLYRDIETLKGMGAAIDGEAGIGFQLSADYFLPPLMFTEEEIEALVLGLRSLTYGPDAEMSRTARDASAKIAAALPPDRRDAMQSVGLFPVPRSYDAPPDPHLGPLRRALREELQVGLDYVDLGGSRTQRTVYPVALGYYEDRQVLIAWCTLRGDWRRFRIDNMRGLDVSAERLPEPRRTLFFRWRRDNNLPELS